MISLEDLEELEDLDELEELEDLNASKGQEIVEEQKLLHIQIAIGAFAKSLFPVLLVDSAFRILYSNEACNKLFDGFYVFAGNGFIDVFGRVLGAEAIREIRAVVKSGIQGYSWKGSFKSKEKATGTIITKAYLFPVYSTPTKEKKPEQFVVLIDNVTEENKTLLRSVFLSLLEASKLKDNDTGKHIIRVNKYSFCLASFLYDKEGYESIDKDFIDDIGFLASMHDVGKIGVPDDIMNKEGPLSDWEWTIMKEHTKNGAYILSTYPNPMARDIALNHHERWDGSGYPFKLEKEMIPLAARIVSIADVYDALRMKRSYKLAYEHSIAIEKIVEWKGSHFDPKLVDKFLLVSDDFASIYADNAD
ncbi:HD-GYP domain-containing protein [Treponema sp.]